MGRVINPPMPAPSTAMSTPNRSAHPRARSANGSRKSATATASDATHWTRIAIPMTVKTAASKTVDTLKWLVVPRAACMAMSATSTMKTAAVVAPAMRLSRGHS